MEPAVWMSLILVFFLTILSVQDVRSGYVSLYVIAAAAAAGTVLYIFFPQCSPGSLLVLLAVCSIPILPAVFGRQRIGAGDALILPVCALYLGRAVLAVLLFASFFAAGAAAVCLLLRKARRTDTIRFFPFLLAAEALYGVALFWESAAG